MVKYLILIFGFCIIWFLSCTTTETSSSGIDNPVTPTSKKLIVNFVSTVNDTSVAAIWTVKTGYSNGCGDVCNQNLISNESRSAFHVTVDFSQECGVDGVCTVSSPDHVIYSVTKTG